MFKKNKFLFLGIITGLVLTVVFSTTSALAQIATYSQINGGTTLKVGSQSGDVSTLQKFLASNKDIYPAGLITGNFDSLTKEAVVQFQLAYHLFASGIADETTNTKVNNLIVVGRGMDLYAPIISNLVVTPTGRSVNFTFSNNEIVKATLLYHTDVLSFKDLGLPFRIITNKGAMVLDNTFSVNKQFMLNNLLANTSYNYTLMTTDASGNISVLYPRVFRTGQ